jgi:hypothetical protein
MTVSIAIDPNLRIDNNATLAGFDDILTGSVSELDGGMSVMVSEPESGAVGSGQVLVIDRARKLIQLAVDWKSMHIPIPA